MIYASAKLLLFVRFHDMTSSGKGVMAKGYGIHGLKVELTMDPACEEQKSCLLLDRYGWRMKERERS